MFSDSLNIGGVREWLRPPIIEQKLVNEKPPIPTNLLERSNSTKTVNLADNGVFTPVVKMSVQKEYLRYLNQFKFTKSPFQSDFLDFAENRDIKMTDHPDYSKFQEYIEKPNSLKPLDAADKKLFESFAPDTFADTVFSSESKEHDEQLKNSYQRWFDTGVYPKERTNAAK